MTDPQKPKNDERQVEWSFDFSKVGESINTMLDGLAGDEEVQISEFSLQKAGTKTLTLNAAFSVGKASITALPEDSPLVFNAHLKHVGNVTFESEGTAEKVVTLRQKVNPVQQAANSLRQGLRAMREHEDLAWNIGLGAGVPLVLNLQGGVGSSKIDLTSLTIMSLNVDTGVGKLDLIVPQQDEVLNAQIKGGVGETKIYIPDNAHGDVSVNAGVGAVQIVIPPNAAVQINANGGIGSVKVPNSLQRLTKPEFMDAGGVWQSEGYELAEHKLNIRYDGGVGALVVREAELV